MGWATAMNRLVDVDAGGFSSLVKYSIVMKEFSYLPMAR
jgi:hypothetical protein